MQTTLRLCLAACVATALSCGSARAADPGECTLAGSVETRAWKAWTDLMPPQPDRLFVTGEVEVPNSGVEPLLRPSEPQDRNPLILTLDLYLCQMPGVWPQALAWKPVRFEGAAGPRYTQVHIRGDGADFGFVTVEETN